MNNSLFPDLPESLSPRSAWAIKHGVKISETEGSFASIGRFKAQAMGLTEYGRDHEDALSKIAKALWIKKDIKPWNAN
tara:strand:- start:167 stop:400 length:234 start_codon:yes stop_codon:yes gene_type:complete